MSGSTPSLPETLYRERVRQSLSPVLETLDRFLAEERDAPELPGCVFWLAVPTEDIRPAAECLLHLGFEQDFRRLVDVWGVLRWWVLGPLFEALAPECAEGVWHPSERVCELCGGRSLLEGVTQRAAKDHEYLRRQIVQWASTFADHVRQVFAAVGIGRLRLDPLTYTVELDGRRHVIDDPRAFLLYQTIANAGEPITRAGLRKQVKGTNNPKAARGLINKLPAPVRETVKHGPPGFWLVLPPLKNKALP
jgi:hypothetical protein